MKKLFTLLILLFTLAGCEEGNQGAPTIDAPEELYIGVDETFDISEHIKIYDDIDGDILFDESMIDFDNVDYDTIGEYQISFTAYNSEDYQMSAVIFIFIVDKTAPIIELVGDEEIIIHQFDNYVEQGILISDNYYEEQDLSQDAIENNLDTSIPGEYIIEYSVTDPSMNSSEVLTRKIIVGYQEPSIEIMETPFYTSFSFQTNIPDEELSFEYTDISIYDNDVLLNTIDFSDLMFFNNLLSNHEYSISVSYKYDLQDTNGLQEKTISKTINTKTSEIPDLDVTYTADYHSIDFSYESVFNNVQTTFNSISLYKGDELVENLSLDSITKFDNLLSNNEYTLLIDYSYDLNDGVGVQNEVENVSISTLEKAEPTLTLTTTTVLDERRIRYEKHITDPLDLLTIDSVRLYVGEVVYSSLIDLNWDQIIFGYFDTNYDLVIEYSYDLQDGEGTQTDSYSTEVIIPALSTPEVADTEIIFDNNSITVNLESTDVDDTIKHSIAYVYKNNVLVQSKQFADTIRFDNLIPNQEYKVVVSTIYNLNSISFGDLEITTTETISTLLYLGEGTIENPYKISTSIDFQNIELNPYAHYELTQNIDFAGRNFNSFESFNGSINGNNFSIRNLHFTKGTSSSGNSLITMITNNYGLIKDLKFDDYVINYSMLNYLVSEPFFFQASILVGFNYGTIDNVDLDGTISINATGEIEFGGIAFSNSNTIINSDFSGNIIFDGLPYEGHMIIDGIVASNNNGATLTSNQDSSMISQK